MKKGILLAASAALLVFGALLLNPVRASAQDPGCWLEGTTWDKCNGLTCPGGWCCLICPRPE